MRAFTPEISWHNRLPALSLDIATKPVDDKGNVYRIATGGNDCRVYIWLIDLKSTSSPSSNGTKGHKSSSNSCQFPEVRIRAGLRRHQKSVGAVRFSPQQQVLASGDDDGYIYIWRHKVDEQQASLQQNEHIPVHLQPTQPQNEQTVNVFLNDDGFEDLETWQQQRVLRGHIEDICDLAWSRDGLYLLSGSVDNSAILWDATKGNKIWCSDLIKGYVQGVAIDPHSQFLAAISSDRSLRIYNFADKRLLHSTRRMNVKSKFKAFFCDDTVQTFCRRLEFSPDGQFLIAPTSRMIEKEQKEAKETKPQETEPPKEIETPKETLVSEENPLPQEHELILIEDSSSKKSDENILTVNDHNGNEECEDIVTKPSKTKVNKSDTNVAKKSHKPFNVFLIFKRTSFNKPVHYYPTGREVALCARFSPIVYKLRDSQMNFWGIPYRIVFAVATTRSVIIYDSQQPTPIGYASQIHLARLTDLAWSSDGRLLMITSYDGYSTMLTFDHDEFGERYEGPLFEPVTAKVPNEADEAAANGEEVVEFVKPLKKGQKRFKGQRETAATKKEKLNLENESDKEQQNGKDNGEQQQQQPDSEPKSKNPKKGTPKKIAPTRVAESSTIWRFVVKKKAE